MRLSLTDKNADNISTDPISIERELQNSVRSATKA